MKVDIISGFLGAGKTSFINKYLPLIEGKSALIENEFGDVSIDTDLIIEEVPVKEIFAGCICCTLRGDFANGISEINESYSPDRIVIEPSGVGRLSDVVQGIEDAGRMTKIDLEVNKLISLVDADTYWDYKENFGPFYLDQIENANIIFLSNLEEFSEEEISAIAKDIALINKEAIIFSSDYRDLDSEDLLTLIEGSKVGYSNKATYTDSVSGDMIFSSFSVDSKNLTEERLSECIKEIETGKYGRLLRVKGFIQDGGGKIINYTPSNFNIEKTEKGLDELLVIIGTDLKRRSIKNIFKIRSEDMSKLPDKMTPIERLEAFLKGEEMDRILIMPIVVSLAHRVSGISHREKRESADLIAKSLIDSYEKWHHDIMIVEYGLHGVGAAMGTSMNDPEDSVPATMKHILEDLDDIDKLNFNLALKENDPWLRRNLEAVKICIDKKGDEVPVAVLISGPFTAATSIYSMDHMLRSMRKNPDQVHKLIRKTTDVLKEIYKDFIEAGAIIVQCDPIASGTILHQKQYREFVKPYAAELGQLISDIGGTNVYHICGDSSSITEDMVETGCHMLSVDNIVDLSEIKEKVGHKVPILGNVDPVGVLLHGPKEDIYESVRVAIGKTWDSPKGFILASGCDITQNVPLEHIDYFMDAGRKYGSYPLNIESIK